MSFNPISGYNPPDDDPASRLSRRTRFLLLSSSEDAAYAWMRRHPDRYPSAAVWPGRFHGLSGLLEPFDRLSVSADAFGMDTHIAACLTRVKGPDGLTPGQRLNADEVGARLRGAS